MRLREAAQAPGINIECPDNLDPRMQSERAQVEVGYESAANESKPQPAPPICTRLCAATLCVCSVNTSGGWCLVLLAKSRANPIVDGRSRELRAPVLA